MPNRILREGILTSEPVNSLAWAEEVFYRRLMSVVDDFGRYFAAPKLIRAACFPLLIDKVSDSDVEKWLTVCVEAALVRVYPASDGKRYLELLNFRQQARAKDSKFPAFDVHVLRECLANDQQPIRTRDAPAPVFGVGVGVGVGSEPNGSDAAGVKANGKVTDPDEIIFGYGVPLLTVAGSTDKHARSFLAGLKKAHGPAAVVDKLRECVRAKPLQPLEWLAAALPPKTSKHAGFAVKDYREGVTADGSL